MNKKNNYNKTELLNFADGQYGEDRSKLPLPPMLMIDRIKKISEEGGKFNKGLIIAEMDINPKKWFFDCHFKDDPVMPGCLGLDALWQLTGFFLTWMGGTGKGRALGCGEVKFKGQIRPHHERIYYHLDIKKIITKPIFMGLTDATVGVEDKSIYFAKNLQVGLFNNLTYPPPPGELEPF
ncbi:MAG: bifunctional 3-hydroxydecanoyl-ACP dehydratase/trans-2-decenoyl-ACP isomerase [Candidatus Marinimicrobia bacterium]|nr:bifunctional 3-hydroxydecanoyl-ACP dehydratase/trans-2-decenoyl-ACP isomerase [Candidatus Neomarinimicrobiota bacterium]|tara:strand:- start:13436 stop:13975 length:540 start_codon:yes stop_codon:yes gene_type:complete